MLAACTELSSGAASTPTPSGGTIGWPSSHGCIRPEGERIAAIPVGAAGSRHAAREAARRRPPRPRRAPRRRAGPARPLTDGTIAEDGGEPVSSFLGSTVDLSLGGACVRTYESLTAGMRLSLRFRLLDGDLSAVGEVTHVTVDPIGCRMAGVRFDALPPADHERLRVHLARVRPAATAALDAVLKPTS